MAKVITQNHPRLLPESIKLIWFTPPGKFHPFLAVFTPFRKAQPQPYTLAKLLLILFRHWVCLWATWELSGLFSRQESVSWFLRYPPTARTYYEYSSHGCKTSALWFSSQILFRKTYTYACKETDSFSPIICDIHQNKKSVFVQRISSLMACHIVCIHCQCRLLPFAFLLWL